MRLSQKLKPELVLIRPQVSDRDELFRLFGEAVREAGLVVDSSIIETRLREREAILSTGIGGGVAVPHAQVPGLGALVMAASVHPEGLAYPALDGEPVRLVFCLLGDTTTTADHLAGLARLARLARSREALDALVQATSGQDFLDILVRLEEA
jgi:mannitol/fructose-specific phosphotransferase system IIA component (Ntr-type)